jgi:UDP-2-acetamido-3-amino-2,3-dideoxy-glucuronate N-acetyltransferase
MKCKIVLVGHGHWGTNIARNLHELGCLYGICETDPGRLNRAATLYPGARLYESFDSMLAVKDIDAVAIAAPAALHDQMSVAAMQAGKDVFVEKPLALKLDRGRWVVARAQAMDRILMVGHLLEYHYAVKKLVELVREGELGTIQYIYSNRLNLGRFRTEENILWSFAPHDIAVILRILNQSPIEVAATGGTYLQPDVADTTVTNLLFRNGVRAHIFVSWLHPYKEQRLVVVGSTKMAVFDDAAAPDQKLIIHDKGADWVENKPVPRRGEGTPVPLTVTEPLRSEMEHFVDCLSTRNTPLTDGLNGLRVLGVLEAAQRSLRSRGTVTAVTSETDFG